MATTITPTPTRHPPFRSIPSGRARVTALAALTALALGGCAGSDEEASDPTSPADDQEQTTMTVTLDATVTRWDEERVEIDYTIGNDAPGEIVVFDGLVDGLEFDLRAERIDGGVRLFKGKIDTGDISFDTQPVIEGRILSPGDSLSGSGGRDIPVEIEVEGTVEEFTPDSLEFCIGYGNADLVLPTMLPDGNYTLNTRLDLQSFACRMLARDG